MSRRVLAIALAINAVCAAGFAQRIDLSGTWRLDREASAINTAEGLAGLGEPAPADLHITHAANGALLLSSRVNGAQPRAYLVEGGSTVPAPGGGTMLMATRWRNGALVSEGNARVDGNTVGIREVMTLSADGRTLTLEITTTLSTGAETNTLVYRKAGSSGAGQGGSRATAGSGGAPVAPGTVGAADDWPIWGADAGGTKYSHLDQINRDNVGELVAVWSWETGEQPVRGPRAPLRGEDVRPGNFEVTPLVIDGVMYLSTPYNRVVALDAATGEQLWAYDPRIWEFGQPPNGTGLVHRGVAFWEGPANADGSGEIERRLFLNSRWRLIALDADTGEPIESFGPGGEIDLTEDLIWPTNRLHHTQTSPPVVYENLVILGNGVGDRLRYRNDPPGDIQAFDVRSGERVWRFSPIPQAGEYGNDTWEDGSWQYTGHTNVWAPFTLDDVRGLLYLPVGTPSNDYYGGHRKGDNLFAESILCLNAATGERFWHFQTVHHGLWDYDVSSPPTLLTIEVEGRPIDVVAQPTKQGFLFVFDRASGEPVWPIEERPVPTSDAPGERSAATQPFPTRPAPFARQGITEADLMGYTPELKAMALETLAPYRWGEMFLPPSTQGSVVMPGLIGGANYGGAAADIETGVIYVKASNSPSLMTVVEADPAEVEMEYTGATGTPRLPNGLPLLKPPYGTLTAIDLNSGEHVWQVPVGDDLRVREHPALRGIELPERLGATGHSGPIVTAGGVVFITGGASSLYAFDAATGEELWSADLGAASGANPMTFTDPAGRQLVVIASGRGSEAKLTAFALRSRTAPEGDAR